MQNTNDMHNEHLSKPSHGTNQRKMPGQPVDGADHSSDATSAPMHGSKVMKKSKPRDGADHSGHVPSMPCSGTCEK